MNNEIPDVEVPAVGVQEIQHLSRLLSSASITGAESEVHSIIKQKVQRWADASIEALKGETSSQKEHD